MAQAAELTIDDYEKLPDALARNHELIDGELVEVSGNTLAHNKLRDLLGWLLRAAVERAVWASSSLSRNSTSPATPTDPI